MHFSLQSLQYTHASTEGIKHIFVYILAAALRWIESFYDAAEDV